MESAMSGCSPSKRLSTQAPKWVVLALLGTVAVACTFGGDSNEESSPAPAEYAESDTTQPSTSHEENESVVISAIGVDVEVSNAVAPYDHSSNVDSLLLEMALADRRNQAVFDCIEEQGFDRPADPLVLPERDDPSLMANLMFPDTERLAREGVVVPPPSPAGSPQDSPSEAAREASSACAESTDAEGAMALHNAFFDVRAPWEDVLAEVDGLEEIATLKEGFSECLQEEGIPAESATELGFLTHTDVLRSTATEEEDAQIRLRMGKLYAECGRDLFEARERLRGGERREAFLREHEDSIRGLSDALFGTGG